MNELVKSKIDLFREAMLGGIASIVRASEIYVEALDEDPNNRELFVSTFSDWIPQGAWSQFEAVGRKWMHPRLLMGGMSDRKKASIIKSLPYSLQESILSGGKFELLVFNGDIINVDINDATVDQAKQLCAKDHIRTLGEQKAWIIENSKLVEKDLTPEKASYVIYGGKCIVRRDTEFNKKELRAIIARM